MSLATFKKKARVTMKGCGPRLNNFSQAVTGVPANRYGIRAGRTNMGRGLGPRIIHGVQPTKGNPVCVNLPCSQKVPIVQKSYSVLYRYRRQSNCNCNTCKVNNDSSSLHTEKKGIKALKCKKCCKDTNVTLNATGAITTGQTQFVAGCTYTFTFGAGDITSINGVTIAATATTYSLSLPSELCGVNQVIIISGATTNTFSIVLPNTSEENCVKIHTCNDVPFKTTAYVKLQDKCPTTKNVGVRSSSEQLAYMKSRRVAYSADPVTGWSLGGVIPC